MKSLQMITLTMLTCSIIAVSCSKQGEMKENQAQATTEGIPSLQAELDAKKAAFEAKATPERLATFNEGVHQVAISGVLETALKVGDTAPDFVLPNATGDTVRLTTLLAKGPVVLTWYRGGWCPYCNLQLHAYNRVLDSIHALGGQLVAVSPEIPDSSLSTKEKDSLNFEVLSDAGNAVAKTYGVAYTIPDTIRAMFTERLAGYNGDSSLTLPIAATYIINTDRLITYAFIDGDYKKRAEPADLLEGLKKLMPM